jgi:hypothetical protein
MGAPLRRDVCSGAIIGFSAVGAAIIDHKGDGDGFTCHLERTPPGAPSSSHHSTTPRRAPAIGWPVTEDEPLNLARHLGVRSGLVLGQALAANGFFGGVRLCFFLPGPRTS